MLLGDLFDRAVVGLLAVCAVLAIVVLILVLIRCCEPATLGDLLEGAFNV